MEKVILDLIKNELEKKFECDVVSITIIQLLSPCVQFKLKFNEDFIYKPFDELPKPEFICFSERSMSFIKRIDLFDSVKNLSNKN